LARAQAAERAGASYVAFGSFFPSPTKPHAVRPSPEILTSAARSLAIPAVAIGGITPQNGGLLIAAGARMLAVVTGVFAQPDLAAAARAYASLFVDGDTR
jgi:thiamine-phosphate pyrophosphorylase